MWIRSQNIRSCQIVGIHRNTKCTPNIWKMNQIITLFFLSSPPPFLRGRAQRAASRKTGKGRREVSTNAPQPWPKSVFEGKKKLKEADDCACLTSEMNALTYTRVETAVQIWGRWRHVCWLNVLKTWSMKLITSRLQDFEPARAEARNSRRCRRLESALFG